MRKPVLLVAVFLGSALLGLPLLLLGAMLRGSIEIARSHRNDPGIGAVAGGISEVAVTMVPLLCGVIGALIAALRLNSRGN